MALRDRTKDRFFRSYEINIKSPSGQLFTIKPPFSMNAQITRNTLASTNKCNVTVLNLSPDTRAQLYKDRYAFTQYWQIVIKAGYTGGYTHYGFNAQQQFVLPTVFQGNIYQCGSQKNGNTWETTFECFDGGYAVQNGFTNQTFTKNTDISVMLRRVITDMPNVLTGIISTDYSGKTIQRGKTLFGQSSDILSQETQGKWFIDNEMVNVLKDKECIAGEVVLLDLARLRTTPKKRETFVDCDCLFFPEVQIGRICQLYSQEDIITDSYRQLMYGQYKIMGINHNINISSAVCGDATTTLSLYFGAEGITVA